MRVGNQTHISTKFRQNQCRADGAMPSALARKFNDNGLEPSLGKGADSVDDPVVQNEAALDRKTLATQADQR